MFRGALPSDLREPTLRGRQRRRDASSPDGFPRRKSSTTAAVPAAPSPSVNDPTAVTVSAPKRAMRRVKFGDEVEPLRFGHDNIQLCEGDGSRGDADRLWPLCRPMA